MISINEVKNSFGIAYQISIDKKKIREVSIQRVNREYNGHQYIFLIDSSGKAIEEVFEYLNNRNNIKTINGREQAATALKLLYSFAEIKNKAIEKFDKNDINGFSDFILGISIYGNVEKWILSTTRSISTHNNYFDAIRNFLRISKIKNNAFFEKVIISVEKNGFGMMAHTKSIEVSKYTTNKGRHQSYNEYVPKYISIYEYKKIVKYIENSQSHYKERNRLIIDLMFTKGLRIGEVLGLTLEDIKPYPNNSRAGILILRNRVSDKKFQCAKTCVKALSKEIYATKIYKQEGNGYQSVVIPFELINQINNYIEQSRDILTISEKKISNIVTNAIADSVEGNNENYYLFLNKNGTALTAGGWSKVLKLIFQEVGIKIDKDTKRNNLSHRFRHGYAMYLIEELKKDLNFVKREMRHKSISSTTIYFNPKPESILKETEKIQMHILSLIKGESTKHGDIKEKINDRNVTK